MSDSGDIEDKGESAAPIIQPLIDYLPPWSEGNWKQRLRLIGYTCVIYSPVVLMTLVVLSLILIYFGVLLLPMIVNEDDRPELYFWHSNDELIRSRVLAAILAVIEIVICMLFSVSFYRAVTTNPGSIPDDEIWQISEKLNEDSAQAKLLLERKVTTGAIRTCARCNRIKPDRCHHCRLCDQCVLKMDHHCPWIANCVGFFNYKYFFLMVTYGMLALWVIMSTFWMALLVVLRDQDNSFMHAFGVTLVYLLCGVLCLALTLFWFFHIHLMVSATTTVEFCEKRTRTHDNSPSPYLASAYSNLKAALGPQPLLWLFPFCKSHLGYRGKDETGTSFPYPNYVS